MDRVMSNCWEEQEAVYNWLNKNNIKMGRKDIFELCDAVTKPRIRHQDRIRELNDIINKEVNLSNKLQARLDNITVERVKEVLIKETGDYVARTRFPKLAKAIVIALKEGE